MIQFNEKDRTFHIQTGNTSYLFSILPTGHPVHLYYGRKIRNRESYENLYSPTLTCYGSTTTLNSEDTAFSLDLVCLESAAWGKGDYRPPSIMLKDSKGDRTFDFTYREHRILRNKPELPGLPSALPGADDGVETLEIDLVDKPRSAVLTLRYTVFPETDIITRSAELTNRGEETLDIEKIMSFSLDFDRSGWDLVTLNGAWIRERHQHRRPLGPGHTGVASRKGVSSADHSPFLLLQEPETTEHRGECYGFSLIYSGNHQCDADVSPHGLTRVQMGINSFDFSWELGAGESFQTPEGVLSWSGDGRNGLSRQFHRFVRDHIVRGAWQYRERPVLINNWEATYFDFNEKKLLNLAKEAADMGVELFVLDDGWFGKRNDDTTSLGDWKVDTKKLPRGLKGLAEKINKMGMDFGLWVEPEMISLDSDLYREHPEWLVRSPSMEPSPGRNQFLLDLTRSEVCDYLVDTLTEVFKSAPVTYVKWDMNRNFSDVYTDALPAHRQQEFCHRYVLGLYDILQRLNDAFPEILFESCASGGNRFDLGMLCYMPQVWTSDNTDAMERLPIQYGTSLFAPPSVMGAHVSGCPSHQVLRQTPLETRFNTAAFGLLGYELDLTKLTNFDRKVIKKQIAFYKEHRKLLQFGEFYRLEDPAVRGRCLWMCVAPDRSEALLGMYQELARPNGYTERLQLKGLDESVLYRLQNRTQYANIRQFGELVNEALPVNLKTDGMIHSKLADNYLYELEKTDLKAFGDQLMYRGFQPHRQFFGTGIDDNTSFIGDSGSRIFHLSQE